MVRRNIRPCSICAGVSATSTVKWCGPVALTMVSSEVAKRWSSAASENADRLAAVAANSSNRVRRDVMRRLGVPRSETTNTKHTLKRLGDDQQITSPRDTRRTGPGLDRRFDGCGCAAGPHCDHVRARSRQPDLRPAAALLTALEGGAASLVFSSGMAAAAAVFQNLGRDTHGDY